MTIEPLPSGVDRGAGTPDRTALAGEAAEVAPRLLNLLLRAGERVGRIVEVEAYGGAEDPASHAHRGPNGRNATMFGPAGHLYCYRSYGIHTCANVVSGPDGRGQAVLVRAVEPLGGEAALAAMRADRPAARRVEDVANGPGKLCEALGIALAHDGVDLCDPDAPVVLCSDGVAPPAVPLVGPRVGISRATELPWRFRVPGSRFTSRR